MKKLSDEAIFILALLVMLLIALIIRGMIGVIDTTEKSNLKAHSEVLTVEGNNYTTEVQTNVLGTSNEEYEDVQPYNGKLCGLEAVVCKNEK